MKILFLGNEPIIKYGIGAQMEKCGIETFITDLYISINSNDFSKLIEAIESYRPDAIFNAGMCIMRNEESLFRTMEAYNIIYIYWAIEDPVDWKGLSLKHAKRANLTFTTAAECIYKYNQQGIDAKLLLFGCNTDFHKQGLKNDKFKHDIIFAGNYYSRHASRNYGMKTIVEPLIKRNYDIKIYGNNWWFENDDGYVLDKKFYGGFCQYEELGDACVSAKIVLGLHSVGNSITMMSMRTFEVLGCRGFYLSQYVPSLRTYFTNKEHLVWSKNTYETLTLVDNYLKKEGERNEISRRGQEKCYKEHNYINKINYIVDLLKVKGLWRN